MRITVDLRGHNDWAPAPPGTVITQADVDALRAKQMSDDSWHMKIEVSRETHFDMGIHEENLCRQICGRYLKGSEVTRAEIVADEVRDTIKHHAARKHMIGVHVHDDGPLPEVMSQTLEEYKITGDAASALLGLYAEPEDIGAHLASVFRIKHHATPAVRASAPSSKE